ncbi:9521_t:CDS:2 [Diversispora eburnea]|uniref:9521_t:CDS:1 n=1 Tax=Diversispora eburnea TaxID=1213867 RepID=A0A9N8YWE2_9GLOM|nr:9521_t:CDS:2 [Diversispora eburnea]
MLAELISELKKSNDETQKRLSRMEHTQDIKSRIDQIWVSDNLADQLFCADIISKDLKSYSDHVYAMMKIEDNIFKHARSITNPIEIMNRIEFNFKGTSEKMEKIQPTD